MPRPRPTAGRSAWRWLGDRSGSSWAVCRSWGTCPSWGTQRSWGTWESWGRWGTWGTWWSWGRWATGGLGGGGGGGGIRRRGRRRGRRGRRGRRRLGRGRGRGRGGNRLGRGRGRGRGGVDQGPDERGLGLLGLRAVSGHRDRDPEGAGVQPGRGPGRARAGPGGRGGRQLGERAGVDHLPGEPGAAAEGAAGALLDGEVEVGGERPGDVGQEPHRLQAGRAGGGDGDAPGACRSGRQLALGEERRPAVVVGERQRGQDDGPGGRLAAQHGGGRVLQHDGPGHREHAERERERAAQRQRRQGRGHAPDLHGPRSLPAIDDWHLFPSAVLPLS